jgi:UDPglucose 6-dehydrogenase
MMNVTVIGVGYVGAVTGACLAFLGHRVTCVDVSEARIKKLQEGQSPIYEPGLEELILLAKERGEISFDTDVAKAVKDSDVIFIAVGTPSLPSGETNLAYLESAARTVGAAMEPGRFYVVVNKSTVPVGCGNLVETLVREGVMQANPEGAAGFTFAVASNPEFLREGSAIHDSLYPGRIVLGSSSSRALSTLRKLYQPLTEQRFADPSFAPRPAGMTEVPIVSTSLQSAEMIKYSANAFLALKIGFANEMANICERVGADVVEVMNGIGLDSRIGRGFLNAGIGWGGSCFGKDVSSLLHTASEYGYDARILAASIAVNKLQRGVVIQKLQEKLFILKGRTIALLGLAFKPDTDDMRDAPSIQIAERLLGMGARVRVFDPIAMETCRSQNPQLPLTYCDDAFSAATGADAVVLVTEWPVFAELDLTQLASRMRRTVLIDGRNLFSPEKAADAGFDYTGIGRSSRIAASMPSKSERAAVTSMRSLAETHEPQMAVRAAGR